MSESSGGRWAYERKLDFWKSVGSKSSEAWNSKKLPPSAMTCLEMGHLSARMKQYHTRPSCIGRQNLGEFQTPPHLSKEDPQITGHLYSNDILPIDQEGGESDEGWLANPKFRSFRSEEVKRNGSRLSLPGARDRELLAAKWTSTLENEAASNKEVVSCRETNVPLDFSFSLCERKTQYEASIKRDIEDVGISAYKQGGGDLEILLATAFSPPLSLPGPTLEEVCESPSFKEIQSEESEGKVDDPIVSQENYNDVMVNQSHQSSDPQIQVEILSDVEEEQAFNETASEKCSEENVCIGEGFTRSETAEYTFDLKNETGVSDNKTHGRACENDFTNADMGTPDETSAVDDKQKGESGDSCTRDKSEEIGLSSGNIENRRDNRQGSIAGDSDKSRENRDKFLFDESVTLEGSVEGDRVIAQCDDMIKTPESTTLKEDISQGSWSVSKDKKESRFKQNGESISGAHLGETAVSCPDRHQPNKKIFYIGDHPATVSLKGVHPTLPRRSTTMEETQGETWRISVQKKFWKSSAPESVVKEIESDTFLSCNDGDCDGDREEFHLCSEKLGDSACQMKHVVDHICPVVVPSKQLSWTTNQMITILLSVLILCLTMYLVTVAWLGEATPPELPQMVEEEDPSWFWWGFGQLMPQQPLPGCGC